MQSLHTEALAQIFEILNSERSPKELVKEIGATLQKVIPFDRFSLSFSQLRYWFVLQDDEVTEERNVSPFNDTASSITWVFLHQKPRLREDILSKNQFDYDQFLNKEDMRSDLILPLVVDKSPVGTFNFTKKEPHFYTLDHLKFAQTVASALALVAKHIQTYQDKEALTDTSLQVQKATDVDSALMVILQHLQKHFDRARIYLYDPNINSLIGHLQYGPELMRDFKSKIYPIDQDAYSLQTFSADHPRIYQTNTPEHEGRMQAVGTQNVENPKVVSEWADFPLTQYSGDQQVIIGKISVDNNITFIPRSKDLLNRQMVLISQATIAIHHATLQKSMTAQVAQRTQQLSATNRVLEEKDKLLSALQEVSNRSFSYLDQDEILDNFGKRIIQTGVFRSLMIAFVDHETETIEVVRAFQREQPDGPFGRVDIVNYEETCGTRYHLNDDNITPITARTGEMQIAEEKLDSRLDARFEENQHWEDKIAYFIPLKHEEKVFAVLATGTSRRDKPLFLNNLKTMEPLFNQLVIALEHAVLYKTSQRSEERLAELLDFQAQMLDTPVVWICAFDNDRKITFWNRAAELISGYSSDEVLGTKDIWDKLYPDSDYFKAYINSAKDLMEKEGRISNIESTIQCKEGKPKTISWHANRLTGRQGDAFGYLALGLDITHRKQLETKIVRLERLKALGELAAGVSHNLNNMLTGILLPVAMLKDTHLPPPDAVENVEDIFISATRARDLVTQLNQSVRKNTPEKSESVDVNLVITQVVRATRARWKDESESKGIQIHVNIEAGATPPVQATASGLHDVLVNLIFNAVDALPKGGQINITTQIQRDAVQVSIEDDGLGMSPETQLRVFEPFFTTKMDVGTGLGLSTAYSQVQRWGGDLSVESELGKGTVFSIKLPV